MLQRCQGLECGEIATIRLVFTDSVRKYTCGNPVHLREYPSLFPSEVPIIQRLIRGEWMTEADEVLRWNNIVLHNRKLSFENMALENEIISLKQKLMSSDKLKRKRECSES